MTTVELQNPLGRVVQEVAIVGNGHHGPRKTLQELLQPIHTFSVQVVGGFVQQQHVRARQQQATQGHTAFFTPGQVFDHRIPGRQAQGIRRNFELVLRGITGRGDDGFQLGLLGGDQQKKVGMLSGGERGRLHLAKTLIAGGNVLLLDEPSNDLDVETLRALEDALLEFAGTVLVISHDRWFLDRIATHILAAEGDSQWTFFDGNYQEYEADKKKRLGEEAAKPKRVRFKALK